ncbi:MAG: dTMP kinase, partial [Candidatus Dormibacteria bacterium]
TDSTLAYQGGGRGLPIDALLELHRRAYRDVWPDLTIYLRIPADVAMHRQHAQQLPLDRIEGAPEDFHAAVLATFEELAAAHHDRIVSVDGTQPAMEVAREVSAIALSRLSAETALTRVAR